MNAGMFETRPKPADFEAMAATMHQLALMRHYRAGIETVRRWCAEAKVRPIPAKRASRKPPADFADIAPTMSIIQLKRRYKTGGDTILRWASETGVEPRRGTFKVKRDVPADFAERCAEMRLFQLREHYSATAPTLKRWMAETGARPLVHQKQPPAPKPRPRSEHIRLPGNPLSRIPERDISREGQAAEHLRRWFPNVHRCDEKGQFSLKGKFWRCGMSDPLTGPELIEKAKRKGFDPDAWMKVAA